MSRPVARGRLLLSSALLCLLLDGVAVASPTSLSGVFRVTITGKPAALNGRYELRFLAPNRVRVVRNGKVVVVGRTTIVGNRATFVDLSGQYACSTSEGKTGIYTYRLAGRRLTFTAVKDGCVGRKLVLTAKPFVKIDPAA
jgi:hypothetical protein